MIALLDGDIFCYRVGFSSQDVSEKYAKARMNEFLVDLLTLYLEIDEYEGFLSGDVNFRSKVAVTAPYKGNRSAEKPIHFHALRRYLVDEWGFTTSDGQEADDDIAIRATELGDDAVIVSIDKDFDQVPGHKYNFVKRKSYYVSPSDGLHSFYTQILTGDRIDNIIGLRGVGPVKAGRLLEGCTTEQECYAKVLEAYGGDSERVLENGRLLWLRRRPNELWEPPRMGS